MRKSVAVVVIISLTTLSIIVAPVQAAMVNTAEVLKQNQYNIARERLHVFIDRSEVRKHLEAWGVNPEEAKARVNSLTDHEIEKIAASIDRLPAGGDGLGAIVGAALIVFLVLLVTDILGYTDVFPFVKKKVDK
jgi:hypothetical protein